jgi:hypothetical protein
MFKLNWSSVGLRAGLLQSSLFGLAVLSVLVVLAGCANRSQQVTESPVAAPATKAAAGILVKLENPGFNGWMISDTCPDKWLCSQHAGEPSFIFVQDTNERIEGSSSLRIERTGSQPWGSLKQVVDKEPLLGRRVKLSAMVKLKEVTELGAGLIIITNASLPNQAPMYSKYVPGTSDWHRLELEGEIPGFVSHMAIHIALEGGGTMWVDDVRLEILPEGN